MYLYLYICVCKETHMKSAIRKINKWKKQKLEKELKFMEKITSFYKAKWK